MVALASGGRRGWWFAVQAIAAGALVSQRRPRAAWRALLSAEGILLGSLHRGTPGRGHSSQRWQGGHGEGLKNVLWHLIGLSNRQTIHVSACPRSVLNPTGKRHILGPRRRTHPTSGLSSQAKLLVLVPVPVLCLVASCTSSYDCCRRLKAEGKGDMPVHLT